MFNALSNVVGYLNAEGYCNADKCHVSTRHNESPSLLHSMPDLCDVWLEQCHMEDLRLQLCHSLCHCSDPASSC